MASPNLIYLFAAYLIIWIVLFGYLLFLTQQISDLRGQVVALRQRRAADGQARTPRDGS